MTRLSLPGALALALFAAGCSSSMGAMTNDTGGGMDDMAMAAACVDGAATAGDMTFECSNVDLVAHIPLAAFDTDQLNDIWGWTDPQTGKEYALVGLADGTEFIDISNPSMPVMLGKLPTQTVSTVWRDIKVYQDHAFIVSEARDHGMQIFDLTRLRGLTSDQGTFEADAHYDQVTNVHNIVINEDSGYAYAVGSGSRGDDLPAECGAPGFHVINIQDPKNPEFVNCFSDAAKDVGPVSAPGYTHDAQCINYDGPDEDYVGSEICVGSNEDVVTFFDVTDKMNVRVISMAAYPQDAYTHQGWFTEDRRAFMANDELDETNGFVSTQRTMLFNVENLDEPEFIGIYDSGLTTIDHNLYVVGTLSFQSNYHSGLRIIDHSDVLNGNLTEVGYFDTYPDATEISFGGQWSNYPYFESGLVVASDSNTGFFVLRPRGAAMAAGL
ncbi:choice-of-anchor B family protein [Rubrivirga sp. IMCC43871]|uniref:choice-of-anchor B family protein n=1 Tax=Rubrivirga sp. IMCC43871 TaxID=3391575 RepID=UPI00398F8F14